MAEIKGMAEALEVIRQLPDHVAPKGGGPVRRALMKASLLWKQQAEDNAQSIGSAEASFAVGKHRLKNNIIRKRDDDPERDGFFERVFVGYRLRTFWGGFVETGTEKQDAQPFLRPVLDQQGDRPIGVFADSVRRDIERIVKRLRK